MLQEWLNKSPKTTRRSLPRPEELTRDVGGKRIYRTMAINSFCFKEPGQFAEVEKFLGSIDHSDLIETLYDSNNDRVRFIYTKEVVAVDRYEHDSQLETVDKSDLFQQGATNG